jgi:hypothetical protein
MERRFLHKRSVSVDYGVKVIKFYFRKKHFFTPILTKSNLEYAQFYSGKIRIIV